MSKKLHISKDLEMPADFVTQKSAWLGVTGSGKTYGASKAAEEMWRIGAQFVVLDPVGVWYGLRLAKDGKKPSHIDIPIFGGLHGDVPLEATAGEMMANLIVDKGLSCVLDVSQFESDADKARFASAFASRFFFRKKAAPSAVHLFLEECQEFVPQNPQRGEEKMLHDFTRMQKLGRNFGIGSSYISQRPQEVNKKALNMAQTLFVFRNTGTHERAAIEKWIEDKSLDESIANDLPKIPTGSCHVWSPEFLKISEMVRIAEKETFNASATPEVGSIAKSRQLAPIDLDKVRADMAATIEKAKADDPKELRKKIIALERELQTTKKGGKVEGSTVTPQTPMGVSQWKEHGIKYAYWEYFEKQIISVCEERFWVERNEWIRQMDNWFSILKGIGESMVEWKRQQSKPRRHKIIMTPEKMVAALPDIKPGGIVKVDNNLTIENRSVDNEMGASEKKILIALAQHPDGLTPSTITALTSFKRSTRNTYISRLTSRGYVQKAGDVVSATSAGIEALGGDYEPLPTGEVLIDHYLKTLPEGEAKIFELLVRPEPQALTRDQISEITGQGRSTRNTYISRLTSRQLIVSEGGLIKPAGHLFGE